MGEEEVPWEEDDFIFSHWVPPRHVVILSYRKVLSTVQLLSASVVLNPLEVPSLSITLPRAWFNWFGSGPGRQYDPEALQMILICCQVENS